MRARFVCQVNWYITRFKFYVQEQFLIWFGFFHLVRWNSNLLLFYWRLTCAMFHFEWNISNEIQLTAKVFRKKWLFFAQFYDIFLVHFKAYAILMLIWSITRRMSARFELILQVSTSPLFMFNWLDGVKCRIFQLQCIFNNRANPSHIVCCQLICNLLKVTIFLFCSLRDCTSQ